MTKHKIRKRAVEEVSSFNCCHSLRASSFVVRHLIMAYLDQFLQAIVTEGASDLHIGEGQPPKMRRHGDVMAMRPEPVLRDEAVLMLSEIAGPANWKIFDERGDLDFAYEMDAASRFRCNFLKQSNGYGAVFRLIPTKIATLEELGIPTVAKEFGNIARRTCPRNRANWLRKIDHAGGVN